MAHLIAVGHPDSGLQDLYQNLVENGLHAARPSRIQNVLPSDINAKLLDIAAGAVPAATAVYSQVKPKGIWKELILDLTMANSGTDNWVWADSKALALLDFWKEVDTTARFLLVYTHPGDALIALPNADSNAIRAALADWHAYNAELLRFYNRNRDRCLLLNADCIATSPAELEAALGKHLSVSLSIKKTPAQPHKDVLLATLCAVAAQQSEEAITLYDEMEATAFLPSVALPTPDYLLGAYQAKSKLADDANLLLLQLHNTQEELEHYYLLSEKSRKDIISLQQQITQKKAEIVQRDKRIKQVTVELSRPMGAVERVQNHLNYRVGKTLLTCSNSVLGWLCLPFVLTYQVLDFRATRRRRLNTPQLPLKAYADAKQARQIQSYRSYRVGTAVMANLGSPAGWLRLPVAIRHELKVKPKRNS